MVAQKKASKFWNTLLSLVFVSSVIYKLHTALQIYTYYSAYIFIFLKQSSFLSEKNTIPINTQCKS